MTLGKRNWHEKERINAIGTIIGFSLVTVVLFACSINSQIFFTCVTQVLLPKLPNNCAMVMDNAPFHKKRDIHAAIETSGHVLKYLPTYSPDLNPIEKYWAKAKAVRKRKRCTVETLFAHKL